ncbi:MAG: bifunctional folylpolyglutamate synthase/dihydrofolate synthase [Actinobacteria bacterium]|nr:bifunctional folylpolyglutamate synthase/dihydrofolate synthase [Actinomycetota bacterium]
MTWREAVTYLDALGVDAMKSRAPSMHRIDALLDVLNHPEREVPVIHVTGTNGKSSVARMATFLLSATGLRAGTYTSPHLESVRERISIAGEPISEEEFGAVFEHLLPYAGYVETQLEEKLTYFEMLTAMFFLWASEAPVDAVVVEVGLGGRHDATNAAPSSVSVITNIGLDHVRLLGGDKKAIAREKAGIVKPSTVAITGERAPDVLAVIDDEVMKVDARLLVFDRDFEVLDNRSSVGGRYLSVKTDRATYDDLFLPVLGAHQGLNAALALQATTSFLPAQDLGYDVITEGFAEVTLPGRLESVGSDDSAATLVLDVAHNPDGMATLVSGLVGGFTFTHVIFVFGALEDKDYTGMLLEMARLPCEVIATRPTTGRAVPPEEIKAIADQNGLECEVHEDVREAVSLARARAGVDELICVTGSHYVVGEARPLLVRTP